MSFGPIGNVSPASPVGFLTPIGPRHINLVPLDVVLEEAISHSVVITEHPIEISKATGVSRGTVMDHAFVSPSIYTMRGGVSNTPVSWRTFRSDTLSSYANSNKVTRSRAAYEKLLLEHFLKLIPFTLVTPYGDLENMLFRTFSIQRNADSNGGMIFSAEFVQLQFVDTISEQPAKTDEIMSGEQAETQAVDPVDRGDVSPIELP